MAVGLALAGTASRAHAGPPRRSRHWGRLVVGTAGVFGVGEAWYWRDGPGTNSSDFALPPGLDAIARKLGGTGFRYDADGFATNAAKHPLFGATMFELAREAGFRVGPSFLAATTASVLWEVFGEWREYGSINDLLATSTSGVPLGETFHQLLHHADRAHFAARVGVGLHRERGDDRDFGLLSMEGAIDRIPGREGPFDGDGTFAEGRRADASLRIPFDGAGARAYELAARTTLYGYYRAHTVQNARGDLDGYSLYVGSGAGFAYQHKIERLDQPASTWDLLADVDFGPMLDLAVYRSGLEVDAGLELGAAFAMVKSCAFARWRAQHPDEIVRGTLQQNEHGYYHAYGGTIAPRVALSYRGWSVGGRIFASGFRALPGHDRYQEEITADLEPTDLDRGAAAWIGLRTHGLTVHVEARIRAREGAIDELEDAMSERELAVSLGAAR